MPYRDRLPVLELVAATPCTARWEAMVGDDRVRHCKLCNKNVYDLNALNRAEAEALIARFEGRLCARYFARHDGMIMLRDCNEGLRLRMSPEAIAFWVILILAGTIAICLFTATFTDQRQALGSVG